MSGKSSTTTQTSGDNDTPRVALTRQQIAAGDGYPLAATLFEPDRFCSNGNVVLVNSATGVKRSFYAKYAHYLCENGFTVLTYDYRGIGDSRPRRLRGMQARMHEWGEKDMTSVIAWLRERYPQAKLLALGHSVGGQVFGLAHNNREVAGLLLVASQSGDLWLFDSPGNYVKLFFMHAVVPAVSHAMGYFPAGVFGLGEDLPSGVAREWARWCRSRHYLYGDERLTTRDNFHHFEGPIFSMGFSDDSFAPRPATEALLGFYPNAQSELRLVSPRDVGVERIGHFGFFRESFRETLWPTTLKWLVSR